jgi:hypothetical protein
MIDHSRAVDRPGRPRRFSEGNLNIKLARAGCEGRSGAAIALAGFAVPIIVQTLMHRRVGPLKRAVPAGTPPARAMPSAALA